MSDEEKREYEELKSLLYTGTISQYGKRKLIDLIKKQSKEIEELKEKNENLLDALNNSIDIRKYWVSKDKIKAKKEEVEQWELYNMKIPKLSTLDERLGAKIGIKYVLQSLLEKE